VPEAIRSLISRLAEVVLRVRSRLARVGEVDLVSQDVLIEVSSALEQQFWMLRSAQCPMRFW
jgi:DNA-binding ferritin-like protein